MKSQPVVIIGGTIAGLHAGLALDSIWQGDLDRPIFLLDPSPDHTYDPWEENPQNEQLSSITIPFDLILKGTEIRHIPEQVRRVDTELHYVITDRRKIPYTDCVLATNSNRQNSGSPRVDGLRHDDQGRALVDSTLQSVDVPNIWIVGEGASVADSHSNIGARAHGQFVAKGIDSVRQGVLCSAYMPKEDSNNWLPLDLSAYFWYKHAKALRYFFDFLPLHTAYLTWSRQFTQSH
jgi:NADH dehydrogenase FAD-containing subunit